jgi:hypothetical protein
MPNRCAAHGGEALARDGVVRDVGQDREALVEQHPGRLERGRHIGKQGALVADHLELHEIGIEQLAPEASRGDGVLRRVAARRIRQDRKAILGNEIEQPLALGRVQRGASQGHRHHLRATRIGALTVLLERLVLAAADDEARAERVGSQGVAIGHA